MLDQLEDRAAELETDNHALHQRLTQLERERDELADTLNAARAMNRELMNQLNREATTLMATSSHQRGCLAVQLVHEFTVHRSCGVEGVGELVALAFELGEALV